MKISKFFYILLFKFFCRIDNSTIFITSFYDKYSDSPRYISEKIHALNKDLKIYWVIKNFDNRNVPDYVIKVKKGSIDEIKLQYKAKVIIDNVYANKACSLDDRSLSSKIIYQIRKWIRYKKGQKVYTTWHGTPLKKMGIDQIGNKMVDWHCENMTMILGNKYTLNIMKRLTFNKVKMKLLGTPRNDILFNHNIDVDELKSKLDLPVDKKILLFAPSFRTNAENSIQNIERSGINQINDLNFEKLNKILKKKFGGEWIFVCRFHYHVESQINWDDLNKKHDCIVINGNKHEDMAEYLKCADVLMTDISSCMFDYALTLKPVIIFFPDLDYYATKERGMYLDIEDLPFSVATNVKELEKNIELFDSNRYEKEVTSFNNRLEYVNLSSDSSTQIAKFILEDSQNGE